MHIKEKVIETADSLFDVAREPEIMFSAHRNDQCSRKEYERCKDRHERGVEHWRTATQKEKLAITMGGDDTLLDDKMRRSVVTSCVKWWAEVEDGWERVNKRVRGDK